jgi:hypothetical protein
MGTVVPSFISMNHSILGTLATQLRTVQKTNCVFESSLPKCFVNVRRYIRPQRFVETKLRSISKQNNHLSSKQQKYNNKADNRLYKSS